MCFPYVHRAVVAIRPITCLQQLTSTQVIKPYHQPALASSSWPGVIMEAPAILYSALVMVPTTLVLVTVWVKAADHMRKEELHLNVWTALAKATTAPWLLLALPGAAAATIAKYS